MDLGLIVPMLIRGDTGDYHDLIVASPKREEEFQRRLERIVDHLSMVNTFTKEEINDSHIWPIPAKTPSMYVVFGVVRGDVVWCVVMWFDGDGDE